MAKPEWGSKRTCQSCSAKFYDLSRNPILCPSCGTRFDPDTLLKSRRARPEPVKVVKPAPVAKKKVKDDDDDEVDDALLVDDDDDTDDDDDAVLVADDDLDDDDEIVKVVPGDDDKDG